MNDPRLEKLARLVIKYSLAIKPGDTICLQGNAIAEPLIKELYRAALRAGAHVDTQIGIDGLREIFLKEAKRQQLTSVSPFNTYRFRRLDAYVSILSSENTKALSGTDPKRQALAQSAQAKLIRMIFRRVAKGDFRWVAIPWPCQAYAQDAEMSLTEYADFVYDALCLSDADPIKTWKRISRQQKALVDYLDKARRVRIVAENTDITFLCKGRKWINCDGRQNLPDGEVYTSPIENSAEGHISFSYPAVFSGREVQGVHLFFKKGRVTGIEANRGTEALKALLSMDRGASRIGELAIGTNYRIQRYVKNTLFDEKIGGTIHLALGASLPETGGKNNSALHWDMVCDLRGGGEIIVDGEVINRDGRFMNKRFPQP